jgi:hypothetical protein
MRRLFFLSALLLLAVAGNAGVLATAGGPRDREITLVFTGNAQVFATDRDGEGRTYRHKLIVRSWRFVFRFKLSFLGPNKQNVVARSASVAGTTSYQKLTPDLTVETCAGTVVEPTFVGSDYFFAVKKLPRERLRIFLQSGVSKHPVYFVAADPPECLATANALPAFDFAKDGKRWGKFIGPERVLDWGAGKALIIDDAWNRPIPQNQPQRIAQSFKYHMKFTATTRFVD